MSAGRATQSPAIEVHRLGLAALQPDLGLAFDDEQQLDIGVPVHRRDICAGAEVWMPVRTGVSPSAISG